MTMPALTRQTPKARSRGPGRGVRGFTIMELGVALAMIGLLMGMAIPSINALSGARLVETTGKMRAMLRDTWARAAMSGKPHRVVFDLEKGSYHIEVSEDPLRIALGTNELARDSVALLDKLDERIADLKGSDDPEDRTRLELFGPPRWSPVEDPLLYDRTLCPDGIHVKLPPDVRLLSVWTDAYKERAKGGQVAIHIAPDGQMQEAHVVLTDDDDGERTRTLVTRALSGRIDVNADEIPPLPRF